MTLDYIALFELWDEKHKQRKEWDQNLDFCASNDIIKTFKRENICNPDFWWGSDPEYMKLINKKQITQLKMGRGLINKFLQEDAGTFNKHNKDVQHY